MVLHGFAGCFTVFQGVTRRYIDVVARCYTVLQSVTRCYRVLHGVSWCNTVFHGVTRTVASIRQDEAVALSRFWPFFEETFNGENNP